MVKLVCFDMDGVFLKERNFWMELHKVFGTEEKGKEYTEKYLHSGYDVLVQKVVNELWKGKDANPYYNLIKSAEWIPGSKETVDWVKEKGYLTAIVSASALDVARYVSKAVGGIDYLFANDLIIKDNKVSGEFIGTIEAGYKNKARVITHLAKALDIELQDVVFIADGKIDVDAATIVGTSIAFNSISPELDAVATYKVDAPRLDAIIPYLEK